MRRADPNDKGHLTRAAPRSFGRVFTDPALTKSETQKAKVSKSRKLAVRKAKVAASAEKVRS